MVSKSSRKGKKAWRKNISTTEVEEGVKRANEEANSGVATLNDDELFTVDTVGDATMANAVLAGFAPKSKKDKEWVPHSFQMIKDMKKKKPFGPKEPQNVQSKRKRKASGVTTGIGVLAKRKPKQPEGPGFFDLWGEEAGANDSKMEGPKNEWVPAKTVQELSEVVKKPSFKDRVNVKKAAVAVDMPGCSFNPDKTQHQDAIAEAVAAEVKKEIHATMHPDPMAGIEPCPDNEDDANDLLDLINGKVDEDEGLDEEEEEGEHGPLRKPTTVDTRKSRADRNRQIRVRGMEQELAKQRVEKKKMKQINNAKAIVKELKDKEEFIEMKKLRKKADLEEKMKVLPPRLGRHLYKAASVQVLCSDEVTGSLRKLKPSFALCKDQYKNYQRLGLIAPTSNSKPAEKKRKAAEYRLGERAWRIAETHSSALALRRKVDELQKVLKS